MMTTFDLAEVRTFAADLEAGLSRCDLVEGTPLATPDAALGHYAETCRSFAEELRRWAREIFAGRLALDPETEAAWRAEGGRLLARSREVLAHSQGGETPDDPSAPRAQLQAALVGLDRLMTDWISPKISVSPSARLGWRLSEATVAEARARIAALPSLPADWQPDDETQRARYRPLKPE